MKRKSFSVALIIALILGLMSPAIFDGEFSAYAAGKIIYTNADTQGMGNGTVEYPYTKFEDALKDAEDGDTIIIEGKALLNEDKNGTPFIIDKNITIKSAGDGEHATLNNRRSGIVLNADVIFQDINILQANGQYPNIYANGNNLTLNNVTSDKSAAQINVFAGGLKTSNGYLGGIEPKKRDSKIVVNGDEAFGGKIFLGGENIGFSPSSVTVEVNDLVAGKLQGVYGQGAESPNFNSGDWFSNLGNIPEPIPNPAWSVVGKVNIDLKNVSNSNIDLSTVEGSTTVNYNATTNYEDTGIFKGIDNFNVNAGAVKPTELTYGYNQNINLTVNEGARLDVSGENTLPNNKLSVGNFVGGGIITLPKEPNSFTIAGTLAPNKKTIIEPSGANNGIALSNKFKYIDFAEADKSDESAFSFPIAYGDRKLVKKEDGWYTNEVVHIFYEVSDMDMGYTDPEIDVFESSKTPSAVKAIANPGYKFLYWGDRDDTKKYSTSPIFTPEIKADGTYEIEYFAYFAKEENPYAPMLENQKPEWKQDKEGSWYVVEKGEKKKGWYEDKETYPGWYFFDEVGKMKVGWHYDESYKAWFFLSNSGKMETGWVEVAGSWYYLENSGKMKTGWLELGNTWYYLKSSGEMATGWEEVAGTWYYFENSGAMKTGWLELGNTWYYLKSSGGMATDWEKINGTWYRFASSGAWLS